MLELDFVVLFCFLIFYFLFIFLAASGLMCSIWDLSLQHMGFSPVASLWLLSSCGTRVFSI